MIAGERKLYKSGWLLKFGARKCERENRSGQICPLCCVSVNHIILYKKGTYFFRRISDESALIRNFLRKGRVRGKL